jgi:hypothetical protein
MWRLIGAASLLAFFTIQGSAPSSINNDLPTLFPGKKEGMHGTEFRNCQIRRTDKTGLNKKKHIEAPYQSFFPITCM